MKYAPCGGVKGHPPTHAEAKRARKAIARMPQAIQLDGAEKGRTIVIMGNSPGLKTVDLRLLRKVVTVGCNRGLDKMTFWPNYLAVADREPYCQERNAGRLAKFTIGGGKLLGSDSLFDPTVTLRPPYENPMRRAQPPPDFKMYVYRIGTANEHKRKKTKPLGRECNRNVYPLNFSTFRDPLDSCLNISGSLIQIAVILGASRIASIGIDLKWPKKGPSHHFGDGKRVGAHAQGSRSIPYTEACFRWARDEFKLRGIEFFNLSPVTRCPFAGVFGNYPYARFIARYCGG